MAEPKDAIKKKIKGQLNKHGTKNNMFGTGLVLIQNEQAFIEELAGILTRRFSGFIRETDLTRIVLDVLMNCGNMPSKQDLATRIVEAIEREENEK